MPYPPPGSGSGCALFPERDAWSSPPAPATPKTAERVSPRAGSGGPHPLPISGGRIKPPRGVRSSRIHPCSVWTREGTGPGQSYPISAAGGCCGPGRQPKPHRGGGGQMPAGSSWKRPPDSQACLGTEHLLRGLPPAAGAGRLSCPQRASWACGLGNYWKESVVIIHVVCGEISIKFYSRNCKRGFDRLRILPHSRAFSQNLAFFSCLLHVGVYRQHLPCPPRGGW